MKKTKLFIAFIAMLFYGTASIGQTTNQAGNWNTAGNWTGGVPAANGTAVVNHDMILDVNIAVNGATTPFGVYTINEDVIDPIGGALHTLTITNTAGYNAARAIFDVTAGRTRFEGAVSNTNGTIRVRNGATLEIGALTLSSSAKLIVDAGGTLIVNGNFTDNTTSTATTLNGFIQINGNYTTGTSAIARITPTPTTGVPQMIASGYIASGGLSGTIYGQTRDFITTAQYTTASEIRCGTSSNAFIGSINVPNYVMYGCSPASFGAMTHSSNGTVASRQWEVSTTGPGSGFTAISGATAATYTSDPGQTVNKWYRVAYTISGCTGSPVLYSYPVAQIVEGVDVTWQGTESTAWSNPRNWSGGFVPNKGSDVVIPSGTPFSPVLGVAENAYVKSLTINTGATLTQSDISEIIVNCGSITNNGTLSIGSASTLHFTNGSAQQYTSTSVLNLQYLKLTNSNLTFNSNANLIKEVALFGTSTFDPDGTSNNLVFLLESTGDKPDVTARIASIPNGSSITGKVRFKRFMNVTDTDAWGYPGNMYVLISSPVQNATVGDIMNEVWITGEFTGNPGGDKFPRLWRWDEGTLVDSNYPNCQMCPWVYEGVTYQNLDNNELSLDDSWIPFPTVGETFSTAATFATGRGYSMWQWYTPYLKVENNSTWNLNGIPVQGDVTVPVSYTKTSLNKDDRIFTFNTPRMNGYNLIGNPYASTISWDSNEILNKNATTGTIYWYDGSEDPDPRNPNWLTYNYNTGIGTPESVKGEIAAGQGFWVIYDSAGLNLSENQKVTSNLVFKEGAKIASTSNTFFASTSQSTYAPSVSLSRIFLKLTGPNAADLIKSRECVIAFKSDATFGSDIKFDVLNKQPISFTDPFYLSTIRSGVNYIHNIVPSDSISNTVFHLLAYTNVGKSYTLSWNGYDIPTNSAVSLYDVATSTYTNMKTTSSYAFTGVTNTSDARFRVRFFAPHTITSTNVSSAAPGGIIYINGTFPSTVSSEYIVKFNGVQATIDWITSSTMAVYVPYGATTGFITIERFGLVVQSPSQFTIPTHFLYVNSRASSTPGSNYTVYYRINGGSWIQLGQPTATTTCLNLQNINNVPAGSTVQFAIETGVGTPYYNAVESQTCPSRVDTFAGTRSGACSSYYSFVMPNNNTTVSLTVSVNKGGFITCP
jgi:hypothetical protein